MSKFWLILFAFLPLCGCIINEYVTRGVDITAQVVKIGGSVLVLNDGRKPINTYNYYLDEDIEHYSIQFYIMLGKNYDQLKNLEYEQEVSSKKKHKFVVHLDKTVRFNETYRFDTTCYYFDKINSLAMKENTTTHLAKYTGNIFYFSEYATKAFMNVILVNGSEVVEHTHSFSIKNETDMHYIAYNVQPFTYDEVTVIYPIHVPFHRVTSFTRTIVVSHWDNILVVDEVDVKNVGPPLGNFCRYHNDREKHKLSTFVPSSARDIVLYDYLGNNTKLEVSRIDDSRLKLVFEPRFPLLRSYRAYYVVKYTVPTYLHIQYRGEYYEVILRLFDFVLPEAVVENATMRVMLPDGAVVISKRHPPKFRMMNIVRYNSMLSFTRKAMIFKSSYLTQGDVAQVGFRYTWTWYHYFYPAAVLHGYIWTFLLSISMTRRFLKCVSM